MNFTPKAPDTLTQLYNKGDSRLKRVAVSIRSIKNPEEILPGYALMTELNEEMLSFFSTQKFLVDETLNLRMTVGMDDLEFQLKMSHLHEQISSGRIMTAVPTEEHPFPARKFYRCFAKVVDVKRNGLPLHEVPGAEVTPITAAVTPAVEAVPEVAAEMESELKVA